MSKLFLFGFIFFCQQVIAQDTIGNSGIYYPFPAQNGWTFINEQGVQMSDEIFDSVLVDRFSSNSAGYLAINNQGKYGFLQTYLEVKTLVPFEFDTAFYVSEGIVAGNNRHFKLMKINYEEPVKEINLGQIDHFYRDDKILYTYSQNGTGVLKGGHFLSTTCDHLIKFDTKTYAQFLQKADFWLVSKAGKLGLYKNDSQIIPCVAESIQPFNQDFIRYWVGHWIYLRVDDLFVIDSKGRRVQIYSHDLWKVYDPEMKTATLYEKGIKKFGQYEDYFPIEQHVHAVRKNNWIGTIDQNGNTLIPLEFEQVTPLFNGFYKCLKDEKWFLTSNRGVKWSQKGYDQIFSFGAHQRGYEVRENNFCGIIDSKGKEVLRCEFDAVADCGEIYMTVSKGFLDLYDSIGTKLTSNKYVKYEFKDDLVLLFLDENRFDVFSKAGKLNAVPLNHAYFFDEVVKGYSPNELQIMSYDAVTGKLEENQRYPGVKSFEIKDEGNSFWKQKMQREEQKSYLEENQLNGKYGFRAMWSAKLLIEPVYVEVSVLDFEYLACVESFTSSKFRLTDETNLHVLFDFDIVSPDAAAFVGNDVLSSTFRNYDLAYGSSVSTNRVMFGADGKARFDNGNKFKGQNISDVRYANNFMVYNTGGKFVPATENTSSISLYDLYNRRNSNFNLAFEASEFDRLLDPSVHFTLEGGAWTSVPEELFDKVELSSSLRNKTYNNLRLYHSDFESNYSFSTRNDQGKLYWSSTSNDTTVNVDFYNITPVRFGYFEVEDQPFRTGVINVLEPEFIYVPNDSTKYVYGRLIRKNLAGFQLFSVRDSLLNSMVFDEIVPFGKDLFKAKTKDIWLLLDRDGQQISDLQFTEISEEKLGAYEARLNGKHVLLNNRLEETANLGSYERMNDVLFRQKVGADFYIWNPFFEVRDTLKNGEELLSGSMFISGKYKGKGYVRLFGSASRVNTGITKPVVEGPYVLSKFGKYFELIAPSGTILVDRKKLMTDYEVNGDFIHLKSEKNWMIFNLKSKMLYSGKKGKSVNFINGYCVLEFSDETFALRPDGSRLSVDEATSVKKEEEKMETPYRVEKEEANQQFGVKDWNGQWIILPTYGWISPAEENEFNIHIPARKGMMASLKQKILPADFDAFYEIDYQTWLVKRDNQYGIYNQNTGWMIRLR